MIRSATADRFEENIAEYTRRARMCHYQQSHFNATNGISGMENVAKEVSECERNSPRHVFKFHNNRGRGH